MNEVIDRLKSGEYGAYKRNRYARYWLGGGMALAIYTAVSATFNAEADAGDIASIFPFYIPVLIGCFLSPFARETFVVGDAQAKYDEFEMNVLKTARSNAYWCFLVLVLALVVWLWLGTSFDFPIPQRPYDWSAIFMAICAIAPALPVFIAECLIPMPPVDGGRDDDDD